ncbi:hypothetical protein [Micromonospora echinofusca]|uniref:Uncharacterized protein n=1 Tax=Micromonospora echinofusca TaxID=47858 RepID=A0ABS3VWG9_MICEH|nr:hypothetical protein [Micromonospora echinofusca]MBO4208887.1 hypothetical protein [Micromonospora echinofusca]
MNGPHAWLVVLPAGRHEAERLVHHETLELTGLDGGDRPRPGDDVLVAVGDDPPSVVALGRVARSAGDGYDPDDPQSAAETPLPLVVTYTRRAFDDPLPADNLAVAGPVTPLDRAVFDTLAGRLGPAPERRDWLVSVHLPIEAATPAEAARIFWSYVLELGPRELPAFVSPSGDELAMQAFVLGAVANQDPEEDDD